MSADGAWVKVLFRSSADELINCAGRVELPCGSGLEEGWEGGLKQNPSEE